MAHIKGIKNWLTQVSKRNSKQGILARWVCSQPGPTGNSSSMCNLTFSLRPGKKNENIQIIAGGSTRSKGSAHNEEAEVNDVEKQDSAGKLGAQMLGTMLQAYSKQIKANVKKDVQE